MTDNFTVNPGHINENDTLGDFIYASRANVRHHPLNEDPYEMTSLCGVPNLRLVGYDIDFFKANGMTYRICGACLKAVWEKSP